MIFRQKWVQIWVFGGPDIVHYLKKRFSSYSSKNKFFTGETMVLSARYNYFTHFSKILEKSLARFFRKISKRVFSNTKRGGGYLEGGVLFEENGKNGKKSKIRSVHFLSWIVPVLHAKFQKNRWSGFRAIRVTHHPPTHEGDSIGPFGFQPGTNIKDMHIYLNILFLF